MTFSKRISAAAMVVIFICLTVPPEAFANYQYPITDLSITDYSSRTDATYTLNLKWSRPLPSPKMEAGANINQSQTEQAAGYEVYYRNSTKSQPFTTSINDSALTTNKPGTPLKSDTDDSVGAQCTLSLDGGSLYAFRVQPYHNHTIANVDGTSITRSAPMDTSLSESVALYLTDISLTASVSGHNMTVTWDDPTMDGREIFTGYRFYYTAGGPSVVAIPMMAYVEVAANSPDLIRMRNGKLQYTFYDETLQIGKLYAVKIEPMFNGKQARTLQTISIDNNVYSFSYRGMANKEYRVNDTYVNPSLKAQSEGQDYVRISWDSLKSSMQTIDSVVVYSSQSEDMSNKQLIGTLTGDSAYSTNFWNTAKPSAITYYQININYKDALNNLAPMLSEISYFDPSYSNFSPDKPTVLSLMDNAMNPFNINIQWQAFSRRPYNIVEQQNTDPNYNNQYIDRNIIYDFYVTDDIQNFYNPLFNDKIITTIPASNLTLNPFMGGQNKLPSYSTSVSAYYTKSGSGVIARQPLKDNTVYYIGIVATRDPGGQTSIPAIASYYIRPAGNVDINPLMMTKPPLRIKTDELGVEQVTDKAVTIQWDTEYYEAYNNANKSWYTTVGVGGDGRLLFGPETDNLSDPAKILGLNDPKYLTPLINGGSLIKGDLRDKGADPNEIENLPVRFMDIQDSQYEIHTVRYDYIQSQGGYGAYLSMLQDAGSETKWTAIMTTGDPVHPEYAVTQENAPTVGELGPNTAYVIYFRPFIIRNEKKTAYFPTYVMTTTKDVQPPLDIMPTIPVLEAVGQTDTSVTIRWLYTPDLTNELRYSKKPEDYPNNGSAITWDSIKQTGKITYEDGRAYLYYTVTNLSPGTRYNVWIRSAASNTSGDIYSAWSNPIAIKTDGLILKQYTINAIAEEGGFVTGGGIYQEKSTVTLKAVPDAGYKFDGWYKDNAKISGAGMEYSFAAVSDLTLYARFIKDAPAPSIPDYGGGYGTKPANPPTKPITTPEPNETQAPGPTEIPLPPDTVHVTDDEAKVEGDTLIIDVSQNANTKSARIPNSILNKIKSGMLMTVVLPEGSVKFGPTAAKNTVTNATGGGVTLSIKQIDPATLSPAHATIAGNNPVYELIATDFNDRNISDFGGNVEVTLPYKLKPGENPDAVIIYFVGTDGSLQVMLNCRYENGNVVFTTTHFTLFMVAHNFKTFDDIHGHWGQKAIEKAAARKLVSGYGNGLFKPQQDITMAEFTQLVYNTLSLPRPTVNKAFYSDVHDDQWFFPAVSAAREAGLFNDLVDDGYALAPNQPITRQEMALILANLAASWSTTANNNADLSAFNDLGGVDETYRAAIKRAIDAGLLSPKGMGDGKFSPSAPMTRAQAAIVVMNLLDKTGKLE